MEPLWKRSQMINNENDSPILLICCFLDWTMFVVRRCMKRRDPGLRRMRWHLMEGMKINDWFQKECYQIDLFVLCMLDSKHGFLIIRKPFCKCCLFLYIYIYIKQDKNSMMCWLTNFNITIKTQPKFSTTLSLSSVVHCMYIYIYIQYSSSH